MTLKGDAKFKEKLIGLRNDIRNLVNFYGNGRKSKNFPFDWLLLSIAYKVSAKKVKKGDTEVWSKLWRKTNFLFEKWHDEFGEF